MTRRREFFDLPPAMPPDVEPLDPPRGEGRDPRFPPGWWVGLTVFGGPMVLLLIVFSLWLGARVF